MLFLDLTIEEWIGLAIALVVGISFHEFSHAFVADQLGDHRPRALGRVSLNPMRHLDPVGSLFFLVAGFGWGKPVPVNVGALRPGRIGMAFVSAAGPIANVVVAVVAAVIFRTLDLVGVSGVALGVANAVVFYNLLLAIFNLIPIPPLDGYNALLAFLSPRNAYTVQRYAPYGIIVLLLLVVLPNSPLRFLLGMAIPLTQALTGA